jgi:outer membrane lipoprotein
VTPRTDDTCFEIVRRPLDATARPRATDESDGRFIACATGFYDPAIYAEDRELTVVGTIVPPVSRPIGDYEYRYPRLAAEVVYLWEERAYPVYAPYPYGPYYGPWYYDPFWDPFWFGGGIRFRHRRH